jgi:hypothetical protein
MDKATAVAHFESESALARALGLSQSTVWGWKTIPGVHQLKIEEITEGKLLADADIPRGYIPKAEAAA